MMKWLIIALVLLIVIMLYKNVKHIFVRKGFKYVLIIILIIASLFLINHYVDLGGVFEEGKGFGEFTGAAVEDAFDEAFESDFIDDTKEKIGDFLRG